MPSAAKIFGAALLNALGKGVEGYGQGTKDYRDYALKKLIEEREAKPSMQRNVEYYSSLPLEQKQTALDLATASGGGTVRVTPSGVQKTPAPPQPRQDTPSDIAKKRIVELQKKPNRTPEENKELGILMTTY